MADYNSVFKRVEKKYRVSHSSRERMQTAAEPFMALDRFKRTLITSLYFDTPERTMIARSLEKPLYKEKLRIRVYGEDESLALVRTFTLEPCVRDRGVAAPSDAEIMRRCLAGCAGTALDPREVKVFFGIKKKYDGVVYKRRLALSLPAALAFFCGLSLEQAHTRWPLGSDGLSGRARQIGRELEAAMDRHLPLVASMAIRCEREAWELRPDTRDTEGPQGDLRITFDDALCYSDCFADRASWKPILAPDEAVMEIKSAGPYAAWLVRALSGLHIYPTSFTKYGTAYRLCGQRRAIPRNLPRIRRNQRPEKGKACSTQRFRHCSPAPTR